MPSSRLQFQNRFVLVGDVALIVISVLASFALRLDVGELPYYFPAVVLMCAVALGVKLPVFYFFGLYRRLWMYASIGELRLITAAVTTASVLTSGVMAVLIVTGRVLPGMPRSALGIDWLLSLILITAPAQGPRTHRLEATPDTVAYGYYWSEAKPVLRIASGDIISAGTCGCD